MRSLTVESRGKARCRRLRAVRCQKRKDKPRRGRVEPPGGRFNLAARLKKPQGIGAVVRWRTVFGRSYNAGMAKKRQSKAEGGRQQAEQGREAGEEKRERHEHRRESQED